MTLNENIKKYYEIKKQIEELTNLKDSIGEEIKKSLLNMPDKKYENDEGYLAKSTDRVTYKYNDETGIIDYLTRKGLADIYLAKKIDTTKLNKELKSEGELYKALDKFVTKNITESLEVKFNGKA